MSCERSISGVKYLAPFAILIIWALIGCGSLPLQQEQNQRSTKTEGEESKAQDNPDAGEGNQSSGNANVNNETTTNTVVSSAGPIKNQNHGGRNR